MLLCLRTKIAFNCCGVSYHYSEVVSLHTKFAYRYWEVDSTHIKVVSPYTNIVFRHRCGVAYRCCKVASSYTKIVYRRYEVASTHTVISRHTKVAGGTDIRSMHSADEL